MVMHFKSLLFSCLSTICVATLTTEAAWGNDQVESAEAAFEASQKELDEIVSDYLSMQNNLLVGNGEEMEDVASMLFDETTSEGEDDLFDYDLDELLFYGEDEYNQEDGGEQEDIRYLQKKKSGKKSNKNAAGGKKPDTPALNATQLNAFKTVKKAMKAASDKVDEFKKNIKRERKIFQRMQKVVKNYGKKDIQKARKIIKANEKKLKNFCKNNDRPACLKKGEETAKANKDVFVFASEKIAKSTTLHYDKYTSFLRQLFFSGEAAEAYLKVSRDKLLVAMQDPLFRDVEGLFKPMFNKLENRIQAVDKMKRKVQSSIKSFQRLHFDNFCFALLGPITALDTKEKRSFVNAVKEALPMALTEEGKVVKIDEVTIVRQQEPGAGLGANIPQLPKPQVLPVDGADAVITTPVATTATATSTTTTTTTTTSAKPTKKPKKKNSNKPKANKKNDPATPTYEKLTDIVTGETKSKKKKGGNKKADKKEDIAGQDENVEATHKQESHDERERNLLSILPVVKVGTVATWSGPFKSKLTGDVFGEWGKKLLNQFQDEMFKILSPDMPQLQAVSLIQCKNFAW